MQDTVAPVSWPVLVNLAVQKHVNASFTLVQWENSVLHALAFSQTSHLATEAYLDNTGLQPYNGDEHGSLVTTSKATCGRHLSLVLPTISLLHFVFSLLFSLFLKKTFPRQQAFFSLNPPHSLNSSH